MPRYTILFLLKITFFSAGTLYIAKRLHELGDWALPAVLIGAVLFIFSCIPELIDAAGRVLMRGDKRMNDPENANHVDKTNMDEKKGSDARNGNAVGSHPRGQK